jgi:ubiquinone/menaquinone biosynthesis C-methylase UbiE
MTCRTNRQTRWLACRTLPAIGRILVIGFGSGPNLLYYNETVDEIIGIDSSPELLALAERAVATSRHKVTVLARSADDLPLDNQSIDTIVVTLVTLQHR